ncbi:FAD-binding and (Fe-S)-binding domain-containing protein [Sphingobium sp.]|uniref:FAD-binding and (Fe-S)-binding domain-containing protein n=1 Tax=Sphingobium sp. TaxID=1912891 RepID=UPI0028BDD9AB|nr:FAD-binding and (Fe-S)-binding domain-containing protein [Sphingobium sp.]
MVDELMTKRVERELRSVIPKDRLIGDYLRRLAYGTDASFYRLIPELVIIVESEAEVRSVLEIAARHGASVTFRAAGTSLSGQAISDGLLVVLGDGWRQAKVSADGATIQLQPGVIGAAANRMLARYGRKIGPDPASIASARIGGITANNSSGMCCGTAQNSYQTLESMRIILADGWVVDTGNQQSRAAFIRTHRDMFEKLGAMGRSVRADQNLSALIRRKFAIKNTTGYALNALIDFTDPLDILQHLLIGSEGTLGFIAEVVLRTVPDHAHKASALLLFPDVETAALAVMALRGGPVAAAEIMDRASLRAVEGKPGIPDRIRELGPSAAALLVEVRGNDAAELDARIAEVTDSLTGQQMLAPASFERDPAVTDAYWKVRKGMFPAVGAMRRPGTTVIIEDVAFPIQHLAAATVALQQLFVRHGYDDAIIFGHALEGNLHFVFTQNFDDPVEVERYRRFMEDVVYLVVVRFDGSLKAEHGTGRNMAPFVEVEWGSQAYRLMQEIKQLLDPQGVLNPGVILNDDAEVHLKHLKPLPQVDALVDQCMECGFCEPTCPSHGFTLSPRQRIVVAREIARREAAGEDSKALKKSYAFAGVDSCAACGLCANACPVGIETGLLMKQERGKRRGAIARRVGSALADHFPATLMATRASLAVGGAASRVLGPERLAALTRSARHVTGGRTPIAPEALPRPIKYTPTAHEAGYDWLYIPSCAARTFGPSAQEADGTSLIDVLQTLAERAGLTLGSLSCGGDLCCGMPWESKGLIETADQMADAVLDAAEATGSNRILVDTSPCTFRLQRRMAATGRKIELIDIAEFLHDEILPRLHVAPVSEDVMLHITCSSRRMGLETKLAAVARSCATHVVIPDRIGCCGFAGDKGFMLPELNDHALRDLPESVPAGCKEGYSTSRTCEIGLTGHSGISYRSLAYLVEKATRQ